MGRKSIIILCFWFLFSMCNDSKHEVITYLEALKNYDFKDVSIRKVVVDPSYNFPYNVYIKLSLDENFHKQLLDDLGLIRETEADSIMIKSLTNIDEYQLYFKMTSINKNRSSSFEEIEKKISWWPQAFYGPTYAGSYLDSGDKRMPVSVRQKRNGRIVATTSGTTIYFLLECWGT